MVKNRIHAFNTHYEIYDYTLGENKSLEEALTYRDYKAFKSYPKYMYDNESGTLYIPRGFDPVILEQWNGKPVTVEPNQSNVNTITFSMKKKPRDENQEKAIRFLIGSGEFSSLKLTSQKILIAPTGSGKTYVVTAAIQQLRMRAIIIMKTMSLKQQWMERIDEYTTLGGPNIVELTSSDQLHRYMKKKPSAAQKIFITTRGLLSSYCKRYGAQALSDVLNRMGIGIKVFDEAHQEYTRTLFLDYMTNIKYTFYVTATFQLSNWAENKVFQTAYNIVPKLKLKRSESARHVTYLAVLYNSHPSMLQETRITTGHNGRFDKFAYIDYQIEVGILERELRELMIFFKFKNELSGKSMILSSKKTTCDYFKEVADNVSGGKLSSCSFYTGNKVDDYKSHDIITATPQMLGTGEDVPDLRFMYNTEPIASLVNTDQYTGRLRNYIGGNGSSYYIEFIDVGFSKIYDWYTKRRKLIDKKVKEVREINHIERY